MIVGHISSLAFRQDGTHILASPELADLRGLILPRKTSRAGQRTPKPSAAYAVKRVVEPLCRSFDLHNKVILCFAKYLTLTIEASSIVSVTRGGESLRRGARDSDP